MKYQITFRCLHNSQEEKYRLIETRILTDKQLYPILKRSEVLLQAMPSMKSAGQTSSTNPLFESLQDMLGSKDFLQNLNLLAGADVIEVSIPYEKEKVGYSARAFPWENFFHEIARSENNHRLTVVRHLNRGPAEKANVNSNSRFLGMDCRPGMFERMYDFKREIDFVFDGISNDVFGVNDNRLLENPNRIQLLNRIKQINPEIIHISAIDLDFGSTIIGDRESSAELSTKTDGVFLAGQDSDEMDSLDAGSLAEIINSGRPKPAIVSIATCNSARRLSALTVAGGAQVSIGVHGNLDDTFSSDLFPAFYRHLNNFDWDLLPAFVETLRQFSTQISMSKGTPVLWSAVPLVHEINKKKWVRQSKIEETRRTKEILSADEIDVEFKIKENLNYSAMHNGQSPFESFTIKKKRSGPTEAFDITVELVVGSETAFWRQRIDIDQDRSALDVDKEFVINFPLSAVALRSVQEVTQTSVFITVHYGGNNLWRKTASTRLVPVDQWKDTDEERKWLPSFVWPRDKKVAVIINSAERYLKVLGDDNSLTFDGYQSVGTYKDAVDVQVQAIWNALVYDHKISYVNPPPTYEKFSQRLRSPTTIITEGRGTCLDLSLLFCACLEYVGINPVMVLISGHAFPGWWNTYEGGGNFLKEFSEFVADRDLSRSSEETISDAAIYGREAFPVILSNINKGALSVIETTRICEGAGFWNSVNEGSSHLVYPEILDAMIDIYTARSMKNAITPLPILEGIYD